MKRNIKILLTMLLLAFTLVGCGEKKYETVLSLSLNPKTQSNTVYNIKTRLTKDQIIELMVMVATDERVKTEFTSNVLNSLYKKYDNVKKLELVICEKKFYENHKKELKKLYEQYRFSGFGIIKDYTDANTVFLEHLFDIEVKNILDL